MVRPLFPLLVAGAVATALVASLLLTAQGGSSPQPLDLLGIPRGGPEGLESYGITLTVPEGETPSITAEAAIEAARLNGIPGLPREVVLAHLESTNIWLPGSGVEPDGLVWAVNIDPATMGLSGGNYPLFGIDFVDAVTGKFLVGHGHRWPCADAPEPVPICLEAGLLPLIREEVN